jgi:hypothetical protein
VSERENGRLVITIGGNKGMHLSVRSLAHTHSSLSLIKPTNQLANETANAAAANHHCAAPNSTTTKREMKFQKRDAKTHPRQVKSAIAELISSGRRKLFCRGAERPLINPTTSLFSLPAHGVCVSLFAKRGDHENPLSAVVCLNVGQHTHTTLGISLAVC